MHIEEAFRRVLHISPPRGDKAPAKKRAAKVDAMQATASAPMAPAGVPAPVAKALLPVKILKQVVKPGTNVTRRLTQALAFFHNTEQTTLWSVVELREENLQKWQVQFFYDSGIFAEELQRHDLCACEVHIDFPDNYPNKAPAVRVVQPRLSSCIYGPDGIAFTNRGGTLCLEFLHNWDPSLSEESLLAQVHYALTQARIEKNSTYTQKEADAGEDFIRSRHREWKPTAP